MTVSGDEVSDHLLTQVRVGTRKSHCDWHFNLNLLSSFNYALSDHIALHYSTENVHEDTLD